MKEMSFHLKGIFLLAFVWGTLASQELSLPIPHADCPRIDDINHLVMLPYGPDCSKYYSCSNGMAFLQQCPYNLQWSAKTYRCDRPEIAQCQQAIAPIAVTPTMPTIHPYIPKNPDITYQMNPNDCNKYYQCQALKCPFNLYWNSYTKKCDFPHLTQCTLTPTGPIIEPTPVFIPNAPTVPVPDVTSSTVPITEPPFSCPECIQLCAGTNHQYLPYQPDCHKFIQCNGWPYIQSCPANLFWNDKLKTCDRFCIRSDILGN